MSKTIKYTNKFGIEITENQINQGLDYYTKIFLENGVPFIEETYKEGVLVNVSKYVSSELEISNELQNNPNSTFDYIYFQSGYKVHEIRVYIQGLIEQKVVSVYNINDKIICYRKYKIDNGNFIGQRTEKSYYDSSGKLLYNFDYNEDGSCFLISNEQEPQADIYAWSIGDPDVTFSWQGFEYYQFEDPLVP